MTVRPTYKKILLIGLSIILIPQTVIKKNLLMSNRAINGLPANVVSNFKQEKCYI